MITVGTARWTGVVALRGVGSTSSTSISSSALCAAVAAERFFPRGLVEGLVTLESGGRGPFPLFARAERRGAVD